MVDNDQGFENEMLERMPARMRLYLVGVDRHQELAKEFVCIDERADVVERYPDIFEGDPELIKKNLHNMKGLLRIEPNRHKAQFMGADEISVHSSVYDGSGIIIDLHMFSDSSPYVFEEDLDLGGSESYNLYMGAEHPPVLVNYQVLENLALDIFPETGDNEFNELSFEQVMIVASEAGLPVHILTDDDALAIENLPKLKLDIPEFMTFDILDNIGHTDYTL